MPVVNIPLPEVEQSISRPIIFSVIEEIRRHTGMVDTPHVFFPGDSAKMAQSGSLMNTVGNSPALTSQSILFIEVNEKFDEMFIGNSAIHYEEHTPVFIDNQVNIKIRPIYATTTVSIQIKYSSISKTEARRWHQAMYMKIAQLQNQFVHCFKYHFLLSKEILSFLKVVHIHREAVEPYNESFVDYIRTRSTDRLTTISDLIGKEWELAIAETQANILGCFKFDTLPDPIEKDETTGTWVTKIDYEFNYEKPIGCLIDYPIMVHNRLLPKTYTEDVIKNLNVDNASMRFSRSGQYFASFEAQNIRRRTVLDKSYIHLPSFDNHILSSILPGTFTIFTALCQVDETNKLTLLDLNDLGDIRLDPRILRFILKSETMHLMKLYDSVFQVQLYRNDKMTPFTTIGCSTNGVISAINPLSLRNMHRIRFSLVTDWTLLTPDALKRVLDDKEISIYLKDYVKEITGEDYEDIHRHHPPSQANVLVSSIIAYRNLSEMEGN